MTALLTMILLLGGLVEAIEDPSAYSEYIINRFLQVNNTGDPFDPNQVVLNAEEVCVNYNNSLTGISCTCKQTGIRDVLLQCTDLVEYCNQEKTWCARGNFDTILTPMNTSAVSRYFTSCTNLTLAGGARTCIKLIPNSIGNFTEIDECKVVINDKQECKCSICENTGTISNISVSNITVDCCGKVQGAIATCAPVNMNGRVLLQFDNVPADQCPGSSANTAFGWLSALAVMTFGVTMW